MFEKNVSAMIRQLRENSGGSSQFFSQTLAEIKQELASPNMNIKTNALLKLGYLSMLGVDLSIAQMPIIEVMSCGNFLLKRPAMLLASLAFKGDTTLTLLTTNIFLKELKSPQSIEVSAAITCLSSICSQDIANGVVDGLILLCSHSKPIVRKKVAIAFFSICDQSPDLFINILPKLKDLLSDSDQTVQSCAVSSFLEFSKRNPHIVVPLIPVFFHLIKEIKNNWIVIKLLRLLSILTSVEPRLWAKLVTSRVLADLIEETKAKSVQVEFCRFVLTNGDTNDQDSSIVFEKGINLLLEFLETSDMNIRCIALGITNSVLKRKDKILPMRQNIFHLVVKCVDNCSDSTVRTAALTALSLLVNSTESAVNVIQQLLALFTKFEGQKTVQIEIVNSVLTIGTTYIEDTEWYLRILILFGSEIDDNIAMEIIVMQFKNLVTIRDPNQTLPVLIAAVKKNELLVPTIIGACGWALGELSYSQWSDTLFPRGLCGQLVHLLLKRVKETANTEAQIDMVWGAIKLGIAEYVKRGDINLLTNLASELADSIAMIDNPSLALTEVVHIGIEVIKLAENTDMTVPDISVLVFEKNQHTVIVPHGLDEPFIELPSSLKVDPRSLTISIVNEEVYTDSEEEVKGEVVDQVIDDPFSINSVMRRG